MQERSDPPVNGSTALVVDNPGRDRRSPTRGQVLRECALFQLKLLVDGLKDLLLSPLSLIVLVVGLVSPRRARPLWASLYRVGAGLDAWIDLFPVVETEGAPPSSKPTMHSALHRAEELASALRRGGVSDPKVQEQLNAALEIIGELTAMGVAQVAPKAASPAPETRA